MARLRRICIPGVPQHIVQRGNNRQVCFAAEQDFAAYAEWLGEFSRKFSVDIHAWVFMTNHVHLLATPRTAEGISRMMQSLGRQYVRYFNHAYCRSGTLWEGRFKSCVIDAERYLLHCLRYIELNPVRAGMVNDPADYAWSSYHTNALGRSSSLCTHHEVYLHLHPDPVRRLAAYRALFQAPVDGELVREIRQSVNAGMALGDSHFREEIERLTGRRVTPEKPGPKKGKPTHESNQQELLL